MMKIIRKEFIQRPARVRPHMLYGLLQKSRHYEKDRPNVGVQTARITQKGSQAEYQMDNK